MRWIIVTLASLWVMAPTFTQGPSPKPADPTSTWLEQISWYQAADALKPDTVVLIPLGAAAKEHGPHLKLSNDARLAEYLVRRVADATAVVVAPPINYHFYPAFQEYPGSTSLAAGSARDLTTEVVRSIARHGPRRFYVVNTGISTVRPLAASAQALLDEGILMRYTNLEQTLDAAARGIREQEGGSHADEIETSMMLHIDPRSVDMSKAVKDYGPRSTPFALTRRAGGTGTYSPTGIWGDPTLATAQKGRILADALVAGIIADIAALRAAAPPSPRPPTAPPDTAAKPPAAPPARPSPPDQRCTSGDERTIRAIGDAFTAHWANADAERIAALWADSGDMGHPDGLVERTSQVILVNRRELFRRREYRLSRHPLQVGVIRCLTNEVAVADGKWELRNVTDANGKPMAAMKGLFTWVLKKTGGWQIEAYRYSIDPAAPPSPTLLTRPGWPGRGGGD
jgi:creatinine amidohydrolase